MELTDRFKAVQALECLAFIAFLAAAVFAFIRYCVLKDKKVLLLLAAMASFSAGMCHIREHLISSECFRFVYFFLRGVE